MNICQKNILNINYNVLGLKLILAHTHLCETKLSSSIPIFSGGASHLGLKVREGANFKSMFVY